MKPTLISGNCHQDERGQLFYNNDFDTTCIKRMYVIENHSVDFVRAWQGHKAEQRWFSAVQGRFKIQLIAIDNWDTPSENLPRIEYHLHSEKLDILYIPAGYISSIQALEEKSKLVVMSDYHLGKLNDEFRYPTDYFTIE
ncbi:WxcM-like domain-containing protein [Flavobacterium ammonificans]|uniref:Sugar epimerase n=1 Tax=Flavobacterium ammonificans TaxID=1751056 RepID=A0ABM7V0Z7_9FLAO|nr:WxcM-like domain-containing protein [Flavobacterium ammonificans]BDB52703.1 sugar epimerase [Flavobacterium ammonificans]